MWENYRITATTPLGGKEEYHYNGYSGYSWYVSPRYYITYVNGSTNNYASGVPKKRYYYTTVGGKGKINQISNPDGGNTVFYPYDSTTGKPNSIRDSHNHTVSYTYNAMGRVKTINDAKGKVTTMTYAPNNVDLTGISNGLGAVSMEYNNSHDMTSMTNRLGKATGYAYNGYGQVISITDPLDTVSSFSYYDAAETTKYRLKDITRDGKTLYSFTYDPIGRVLTRTDPTGLTLMYGYNNLNQVTTITYPDLKEEIFTYSPCCPRLLDSYTDRGGRTTYYTYDALRRLTQVKQPDNTLVKYEYDADGNLTKLTDPKNNDTIFGYDTMKRLTRKTYADGKYETYSYDGEGLLTAKANARDAAASGTTATYSYDENHNLTGITYTDGTPNVSYGCDDYNRVTSRGDGAGAWGNTYDAESHPLTIDGPWENDTVTYAYDDNGRRTSVQPQGGEAVGYSYDPLGRLTGIMPGSRSFGYVYSSTSPSPLPTSLTRPNGSYTTYQYDTLNRLLEIANNSSQQLINADAFTYNGRDMRDTETITNGTPITNIAAKLTTYNYNNINQLLSALGPVQSFAHDADGNMTTGYTPDGYAYTAIYDGENRLKSIDYNDGAAHHTDFYYSADGFLARQVVDGEETRFVRSDYSLLQERDSSNNVSRAYVWDPQAPGGIGGLLELSQGGQQYSYLFDGKGNVSSLIDGSQAPSASYTYDEFGNLMVKSGTLEQPFKFSSKVYDEKTGLSYYGYRFYAPTLGRWMNRDPLGEKGGINLYGFVQNNPVNFVDPYGLEPAAQCPDKCRKIADEFREKCEKDLEQVEKGKTAHCTAWAIGGAAAGLVITKSIAGTLIAGGITLAGCYVVDWLDSAFVAGKASCAQQAQRIYDLCQASPD